MADYDDELPLPSFAEVFGEGTSTAGPGRKKRKTRGKDTVIGEESTG